MKDSEKKAWMRLIQERESTRDYVSLETLAAALVLITVFLAIAVNLAARLESSCKEYDVDNVISEYSLVDNYEYDFLDEVTVKGKSEPVKIYTIRK